MPSNDKGEDDSLRITSMIGLSHIASVRTAGKC